MPKIQPHDEGGPQLRRQCKYMAAEMQRCLDGGQGLARFTKTAPLEMIRPCSVEIGDENKDRGKWRHNTANELGCDGIPRAVRPQAGKNQLKRPLPLELCSDRTRRPAAAMLCLPKGETPQ